MSLTQEQFREKALAFFQEQDKDNSGFIDNEEFPAFVSALAARLQAANKSTPEQLHELVKAADTNGDGKLSFDQVLVLLRQFIA